MDLVQSTVRASNGASEVASLTAQLWLRTLPKSIATAHLIGFAAQLIFGSGAELDIRSLIRTTLTLGADQRSEIRDFADASAQSSSLLQPALLVFIQAISHLPSVHQGFHGVECNIDDSR
jgi:hypothetical protein